MKTGGRAIEPVCDEGSILNSLIICLDNGVHFIAHEPEDRVSLEASGSAVALGSDFGQERIEQYIWQDDNNHEMRMEAVLILTELGQNPFTREQLKRIASNIIFHGNEIRQVAVWGLGKAGLKSYADLLPFIDDQEENVALHAIAAFGRDTPQSVIDKIIQYLLSNHPRRSPAASEILRIIGTDAVIDSLVQASHSNENIHEWILATLGRMPSNQLRNRLQGTPILDILAPMLLVSKGSNWLATEQAVADVSFLIKQNL